MTKMPNPEKTYDQVPEGVDRWTAAVPYVMRALGFDEHEIPTSDSSQYEYDHATFLISSKFLEVEQRTAELTDSITVDPFAIAKRVIYMRSKYPFVPQSKPRRSTTAGETLQEDVCNHLVDDNPGVFGITQDLSHQLRHEFQHGQLQSPKVVQELIDKIIAEQVDLSSDS